MVLVKTGKWNIARPLNLLKKTYEFTFYIICNWIVIRWGLSKVWKSLKSYQSLFKLYSQCFTLNPFMDIGNKKLKGCLDTDFLFIEHFLIKLIFCRQWRWSKRYMYWQRLSICPRIPCCQVQTFHVSTIVVEFHTTSTLLACC